VKRSVISSIWTLVYDLHFLTMLIVRSAVNGKFNRANAILPGWIETEMTAPLFDNDKFSEKTMKRIPQRRWGVPKDFGPIAIYFSSDASSYHTGDSVVIDGGFCCF